MYEADLHYADGRRAVIDVPYLAICGQDFCAYCGDCLECNPDDWCLNPAGGWHTWIVTEDRLADFLEEHTGSAVRA